MVKRNKTLKKILSGSKNVRFNEFTALFEAFGFELDCISGSHHIYSHDAVPQPVSVQQDKNGQAKPYQMKQFLKLIEKYDLVLEQDESTDEEGTEDS